MVNSAVWRRDPAGKFSRLDDGPIHQRDHIVAVIVTRCAWAGANAKTIGSCTPPACPADWTDLGNTGRVKTTVGMNGRDSQDDVYTESGGYEERTCVK